MKDVDFSVLVRSASRTGTKMAGFARRLGNSAAVSDTLSAHQILNGYILRAVQCDTWYNVTIIDPPSYAWLAGSISSNADNAEALNACVPIGSRDDLVAPGTEAEHAVIPKTWVRLVTPIDPEDLPAENAVRYFHMQPQVDGLYRTMGFMRIPVKTAFSSTLDSTTVFSFSEEVQIGMACVVPQSVMVGMSTVRGDYPPTLAVLGAFWVGESQLPTGWRFLQRRIIEQGYYANVAGAREYGSLLETYYQQPGCAAIMAEGEEAVDRYCIAMQCVNQYRSEYQAGSPPLRFYDRQGEHALFILQAEINRNDFVEGEQLLATRTTTQIVRFSDLPLADFRPYPTIIGDGTRPALPMVVWWSTPRVVRSQEGFTTFVHYTAPINRLGPNDAGPESELAEAMSVGYIAVSATNRPMWAIVVITPNNQKHILQGDWYRLSAGQVPDTADPGYVAYPWIIGAFSIARLEETPIDPKMEYRAYALVWEDHWDVFGNPNPIPGDNGAGGTTEFYVGSKSIGGQWALYTVFDGAPTRVTIPSDWAPVFKPMLGGNIGPFMDSSLGLYEGYQRSTQYPDNQTPSTRTSAYYAGDEKVVTAMVSNTYHAVYADLDPVSAQVKSRFNHVAAHDVCCGILDLRTNTIEARGVIFSRTNTDLYCHITVAQEFGPTIDDVPGSPAVLLASVFDVSVNTRSVQLSTQDTKVYISVDGGWTWRPYITDQSGPNGAFGVGNRFWSLDPAIPLDKDFK